MSVKAKDVVKLLPKSKALVNRQTMKFFQGYNEAISQIGERKLKLDRYIGGKILHRLHQLEKHPHNRIDWDDSNLNKKYYYEKIDAINEKLGDLLVCEE